MKAPSGGSYYPGVTFGEKGGPVPLPHPGISLRNEVAMRVYLDLLTAQTIEGDFEEHANEWAEVAFLLADAFVAASQKGIALKQSHEGPTSTPE